ncbi:MAG: nucleotidyltransferase domain-containing protein [Bacteroidota bacterium]|nr:nucleotidyltransferase domain-containing protein [Bacteroidota bacterium]
MRLSEYEINSIRILTREIFGQKTIVKLFGSRLIDSKKGGDIDLFVQTPEQYSAHTLLVKKAEFLTRLEQLIGEQKIDLVILTKANRNMPIVQVAIEEGIVI